MSNQQMVYYVIDNTGKRVSKFYSKFGLAKNFVKKYPDWELEAVARYCVDDEANMWGVLSKVFSGYLPASASLTNFQEKAAAVLVLQDDRANYITLETPQ